MNRAIESLAHTVWNCKYHVVFSPKYRRRVLYGSRKKEIKEILKNLCRWKGIEIVSGEMCIDHVHLLLRIPPKYSVSGVMGYLKGKSSLMIYERWKEEGRRYSRKEFWCRGYYVDTVGKNTERIKEYIREQIDRDRIVEGDLFEKMGWNKVGK